MGIWYKEVVRLDGELKAYVGVQDDYTGAVKYSLRKIHLDGNDYYCIADGRRVSVSSERQALLNNEDRVKEALEWYRKTKF